MLPLIRSLSHRRNKLDVRCHVAMASDRSATWDALETRNNFALQSACTSWANGMQMESMGVPFQFQDQKLTC